MHRSIHIWCSHWPTIEGGPYRLWQKSGSKTASGSTYWSEMARNAIESDFRSSKMANLWINYLKKCCVLIWNGEKCDQKWFSVIQNSRRRPFCKKKGQWETFCGCLTALLISFVIRVLSLIPTMNRSRINSGVHWWPLITELAFPTLLTTVTTPGWPTSYVFFLGTLKFIKLHSHSLFRHNSLSFL